MLMGLCWCVDVLMRWCVDALMRWCVDVMMCWCVDVLMCWRDVLMCWCVDMLMCWCIDVLICWCVVCWCEVLVTVFISEPMLDELYIRILVMIEISTYFSANVRHTFNSQQKKGFVNLRFLKILYTHWNLVFEYFLTRRHKTRNFTENKKSWTCSTNIKQIAK